MYMIFYGEYLPPLAGDSITYTARWGLGSSLMRLFLFVHTWFIIFSLWGWGRLINGTLYFFFPKGHTKTFIYIQGRLDFLYVSKADWTWQWICPWCCHGMIWMKPKTAECVHIAQMMCFTEKWLVKSSKLSIHDSHFDVILNRVIKLSAICSYLKHVPEIQLGFLPGRVITSSPNFDDSLNKVIKK